MNEIAPSGDTKRRAPARMWARLVVVAAGAAVLLFGGAQGGDRQDASSKSVAEVQPNPGSSDGAVIHALARLEPAAGLITIGARPGARIDSIKVKAGDEVRPNDLLAVLEGHDQAESQLALAEAQKKSAERQRARARTKLALERSHYDKLKDARLKAARQNAELTSKKFQELKGLDPKLLQALGGDTRSKFEMGHTLFELEIASIKADLDLKELEADQELQPQRRALEDRNVEESDPDASVLSVQIDLARASLAQSEVRAPAPGRVLELIAHPGEVSAGPLLLVGDVSSMIAEGEIYQTDVPSIAIGDSAEVSLFGKPLSGRITRIGQIVGRNDLRSIDPRALQDQRVVKVTIALDDSSAAANYVKMQVDAAIRPRQAGRK